MHFYILVYQIYAKTASNVTCHYYVIVIVIHRYVVVHMSIGLSSPQCKHHQYFNSYILHRVFALQGATKK